MSKREKQLEKLVHASPLLALASILAGEFDDLPIADEIRAIFHGKPKRKKRKNAD